MIPGVSGMPRVQGTQSSGMMVPSGLLVTYYGPDVGKILIMDADEKSVEMNQQSHAIFKWNTKSQTSYRVGTIHRYSQPGTGGAQPSLKCYFLLDASFISTRG